MTDQKSEPKSDEQVYIEALLERRDQGERLEHHEEVAIGFSAWDTAGSGCGCRKGKG